MVNTLFLSDFCRGKSDFRITFLSKGLSKKTYEIFKKYSTRRDDFVRMDF